jgi:hypothetical protein
MVTTSADKQVPELYATSEEVQTLRTTVETFMKEQDIQNKTISSSLEKLLKLAEDSGAKLQDSTPEDKGSGGKGKDTSQSYKIPQLRSSDNYKGDSHVQKNVNFAPTSSSGANKQLVQQHSQYQSTSQDGQNEEDEYTDYDDGDEYFE